MIAIEDGPEGSLRLLFKYNSSVYRDESIRHYVALFMEALDLGDYEIPEADG